MPRAPKFTPVAAAKLAPAPPNLFAGTSGWAYTTWKPDFYPSDLPARAFLHHYAARLTSVEVNFTFRKLCEDQQLREWIAATPPAFRFSFKVPQRITHFQRFRDSQDSVAEFIAHLEPVREARKLGAILFQLPPNFKSNTALLSALLAAPALADPSLQLAFEFRHESWFAEDIYDILRRHNAALCIAESEDILTPDVHTAAHSYFRLRCPGGYKPAKVKAHAAKLTQLADSREVYAYYKHEDAPTGALNATAMLRSAVATLKKGAR